jgi:uncharacterized protein (TIGR03067 family)
MRRYVLLVVVVGLIAGADAPKKDKDRLQGTWIASAAEDSGKKMPAKVLDKLKIVVEGNKMTFFPSERDLTFTLDPSQKPRQITLTESKGKPLEGIYSLEGDTLKLCLPSMPGAKRPTNLATKVGDGFKLLVLKRQKP